MNTRVKILVQFHLAALMGFSLTAEPLDFTIKGQAQDQVQIERVEPQPSAEMKDVIPFSRLGQTDWILSEELGYLNEEKQVAMMDVNSPKVYKPFMIQFPKPPYFVQAYPPPPVPIIVDRRPDAPPLPGEQETWTFMVIDQNNKLLKKIEGNTIPAEPIKWDGVSRGRFVLRTDQIYSSILVINESPEVTRTIVGEPIWMPALRYFNSNKIVFEFSNKRVYNERQASFSSSLEVLVDQVLNDLNKHDGAPFEVVIYDRNIELANQRAKVWKKYLANNLLKNENQFNVRVAMPSARGEVTQVVLAITE